MARRDRVREQRGGRPPVLQALVHGLLVAVVGAYVSSSIRS